MTTILEDIVAEGERVLGLASEAGVPMRLLGGVAVRLHADELPPALDRQYKDLDFAVTKKAASDADKVLKDAGYEPHVSFNAMHARERGLYFDDANGRQVDLFVHAFRMCHEITLGDRLEVDTGGTVPLAELLLTKLQIVRLNEKDLLDIWAILHAHDVAEHDDDAINAAYIAELLASDWGLWRTSRQTVETARERLPRSQLGADDQALLDDRLARLWAQVEARPKGLRWRSRAKVGDRTKWYEEPEEIAHGALEGT
jgi:hypothetical protein